MQIARFDRIGAVVIRPAAEQHRAGGDPRLQPLKPREPGLGLPESGCGLPCVDCFAGLKPCVAIAAAQVACQAVARVGMAVDQSRQRNHIRALDPLCLRRHGNLICRTNGSDAIIFKKDRRVFNHPPVGVHRNSGGVGNRMDSHS